MSVAELKAMVHQRIDEVEDESLLEEVLRFLKGDQEAAEPGVRYFTEAGKKEIEEAEAAIDCGEYYTHEEFVKLMKERFDRHRNG